MFLHVTTQIPGRSHDDMLGTVGGRGFPHLCVLDFDGSVLATHGGDRSAEGFKKTTSKAMAFVDLRKKAGSGDNNAKIDFAILRGEMGQLSVADLQRELGALGKLSPAQEKSLGGVLANARFDEIQKTAVGEKCAGMLAQGLIPADEQKRGSFWLQIVEYADFRRDADLYEQALEGAKAVYGGNPQAAAFFKQKESRLAELKAGS